MDPKVGVYICKGCDIAKAVDCEKLAKIATDEAKADLVKTHDILCSPEGAAMIQADIKNEGLNKVVVAACSGRAFTETFDFGKDVVVDRTPMREQVAWVHPPGDEDTQMMGEDYIRMGVAKIRAIEPPEPLVEEISKDIMVVGGGMTGMTAAKSAADAGYKVTLVEKENRLGGWATRFKKVFPKQPPYAELEKPNYEELINQVENHENITIRKSTEVKKTVGQPGKFMVSLKNEQGVSDLTVGSVILATGWKPYAPEKLTHLGYGTSADIVTNIQLEDMVANGGIKRPSDGKAPESIAFIQCAGSRDQDHLPYCSAVCCRVSLKQAMYVREQYPDAKVYVIYKDVRSPAQFERFYAHVQEDDGVFFTKGEISSVTAGSDGRIAVDVEETLLGEDIRIKADMVVLAAGMVPTTKVDSPEVKAQSVETEPAEVEKPEGEEPEGNPTDGEQPDETDEGDEGLMEDGKKAAAGAEKGAKILNLSYRQGTDLPTLKYGFPDSHFICFPYETRRTAIYAAGGVRAPMDFASSTSDAYGAALKSIQAIESIARGQAVHPRAGDLSYPEFFLQRCTQCKRCTEECPFGALDEDDKGTPQPNPLRCRRCGVCLGACPERIVSFKNYSINMMSKMIKAIHIPDELDEKPRILAFVCENDALPALDIAARKRMEYNAMIRIIPLRCLGSMNTVWISDALATGFDGVLLLGCRKGDDYQCHFVRGSELAEYRMDNVREKLKQLVLEEERVEVHEVSITDYDKIAKIFDDFLEVIDRVGPNPYKDM